MLFTACPITLQAVQNLFDVPLNLMIVSPAHTPNWDMVADVVNSVSRVYRSPKQCRHRYETVIIPREEGRILYDMNPRKQKKTKGIYKVTVSVDTIHTKQWLRALDGVSKGCLFETHSESLPADNCAVSFSKTL